MKRFISVVSLVLVIMMLLLLSSCGGHNLDGTYHVVGAYYVLGENSGRECTDYYADSKLVISGKEATWILGFGISYKYEINYDTNTMIVAGGSQGLQFDVSGNQFMFTHAGIKFIFEK